jgi:predicted porin
MKKSLLALAVLSAVAGVASAQSAVTVYGTFDAGVRNITNANAAAGSLFTMGATGTYQSNRFGFKGVEDLGNGANAHYNLELGFNSGTGALDNTNSQLFRRTATVGMGGSWGSFDLGQQYNIPFRTIVAYDPFGYKYIGIASAIPSTNGARYANDIQYTYTTGNITARAEYALGETAGSTSTGSAKAAGLSYSDGTLTLGGAYTDQDVATFDKKHYTFGAAYKVNADWKFSAGYMDQRQATATTGDTETKISWVGGVYNLTPVMAATYGYYKTEVTGGAAGALNGTKDLNMVGITYSFSPRTTFYAEMDVAKLTGASRLFATTATPRNDQTGFSTGIMHAF